MFGPIIIKVFLSGFKFSAILFIFGCVLSFVLDFFRLLKKVIKSLGRVVKLNSRGKSSMDGRKLNEKIYHYSTYYFSYFWL